MSSTVAFQAWHRRYYRCRFDVRSRLAFNPGGIFLAYRGVAQFQTELERCARLGQVPRLTTDRDLVIALKLRHHVFQPLSITSDHHQVVTVRGKEPRQLEPDSTGGAGNQGGPVL
jgi:hypothetical protein